MVGSVLCVNLGLSVDAVFPLASSFSVVGIVGGRAPFAILHSGRKDPTLRGLLSGWMRIHYFEPVFADAAIQTSVQ